MSHAEICPHCDQITKGLSGAPKWCCYCGGKLVGTPVEDDSTDQWRRLALQFDGHRMQALWHLRTVLEYPTTDSNWAAKSFLAAPPLSGEQVLAERIQEIANQRRGGDERELRAAAQAFFDASKSVVWFVMKSSDDRDSLASAGIRLRAALDMQPTVNVRPSQDHHKPPFDNCAFKLCDLPGQCRGEGKCHHPNPTTNQQSKEE